MDNRNAAALRLSSVPHPGETLIEYLESFGWTQRELARRSGITPKTISEICSGKAPISAATAVSFEKVFGRPAHFWLNLQRGHEEHLARLAAAERARAWGEWAAKFPLKELRNLGLIPKAKENTVDALLSFLGVSSPGAWHAVWEAASVAYRQTRRFETSAEAISAWVRATELAASELEVAEYDPAKLMASIAEIRAQTRKRVEEGLAGVQATCASAGVAVTFIPALPRTGISGCARWLNEHSVLIALSNRYKSADQLWFTLFHELGHVLFHLKSRRFLLDNAADDIFDGIVDPNMQRLEDEANRFAADTLIPPEKWASFVDIGKFDNDSIPGFADEVGIGPGIVVGRLQREGFLKPFQGNAFKQYFEFHVNSVEGGQE